ncbi:MAG: response regulator [Acidobacteria bacterium]|nr:response regulator [Acidobacteriota bacterium]
MRGTIDLRAPFGHLGGATLSRVRRPVPSRFCLAAVLLVLAAQPGLSLDPKRPLQTYQLDVWSEGLPQNSVIALTQTRDGYLWLGTYEGLVRFDGIGFTAFNEKNTPGLRNRRTRILLEDRAGTLWIGTQGGGLSFYRDGSFGTLGKAEGLASDTIESLNESPEGSLWIGTRNGLSRLVNGRFRTYGRSDGLLNESVRALASSPSGTVWAGTDAGLFRLDGDRFVPVALPGRIADPVVYSLVFTNEGVLWAGTEKQGLYRVTRETIDHFGVENGLPAEWVSSILEDSRGTIWIATSPGGLARLRGGRFEVLDRRRGLPNNSVRSLAEDREGSLWIGTNGGLARLRDLKFVNYSVRQGLSENNVRVVTQAPDGGIWVGTGAAGLNLIRDDAVVAPGAWESFSNLPVRALAIGPDSSLWVGTGDGLRHIQGDRVTSAGDSDGLARMKVDNLHVSRDGSVFAGSETGLFRGRDGHFSKFEFKGTGTIPNVRVFLEDHSGSLWLGTQDSGLYETRDGTVTRHLTTREGLPANAVFALHEDPGGDLLIGTHGGLCRLHDGKLATVTRASGLPDETVFSILDDLRGHLWLTSNSGVTRVSRASLSAVFEGRSSHLEARLFGKADGLGNNQCNGATQPSGTRLADGRLAIPTVGGLTLIDPADLHMNRVPPAIVLRQVLVDGRPLPRPSGAELNWRSQRFEFRYDGLSLLFPELVTFRHRIDGLDEDWIDGGTRRAAFYNSLPPGRHVFRVQACNNDGVWSLGEATFTFDLAAPPWRRSWAWLLYAAALAGTLGGIVRLRETVHRKRTRALEERVRQRTAELADALAAKEASEASALEASQAKSIFLANMSHELRTPLNAVLGFAQLLERDPAITGESREGLAIIRRSGEHILGLINDVLSISKIEAGKLSLISRPFDLAELLAAVKEMIQARAESKGLGLHFDVCSPLPPGVMGDDGKLRQVLINLLGNAVKFTVAGHVSLSARWEKGRAFFEVRDTGPGISPEERAHLFEAFTQTKTGRESTEGTGLGLAISRQIVRLMGGDITVESETGKGTVFRFEVDLPQAARPETTSEGHVMQLIPSERVPLVLVADDTEENRILLTRLLRATGFSVAEAEDGEKAVEVWRRLRPDAIFMDSRMPVMSGLEAARRIRALEASPEAPVARRTVILALTASAFAHERQEILESGADDFLTKPFRVETILEALGRHLGVQYRLVSQPRIPRTGEIPGRTKFDPGTVLDERDGLRRAGGNAALYGRLLAKFIDDNADLPSRVAALLEKGSMKEARDLLHTVKGTAATLGAVRLARTAASLESRLKEGAAGPHPLSELSAAELSAAELSAAIEELSTIRPAR